MSRNPYHDLHTMARAANDWRAINSATLARDLFAMGSRRAAGQHATMARQRLRELQPIRAHDGRSLVEILAARAPECPDWTWLEV